MCTYVNAFDCTVLKKNTLVSSAASIRILMSKEISLVFPLDAAKRASSGSLARRKRFPGRRKEKV